MKSLFRKIFSLSAIPALLAILILNALIPTKNVSATNQGGDSCNEIFTYEKSSDYSDSRVNINFENSDEQIDVSAGSGYQIIEVYLDVQNDGYSGYHLYATSALNNFNPNPGGDINEAKVKVKKVCATPTATPTPTARPTSTPTPTISVTGTPTPTPTDTPNSTITPTPTTTVCPNGQIVNQNGINICIDCPGDGECEVIIGGTPTPTPTEESAPTPTPTQTPSSGGQSSTTSDPGAVTVQSAVEEKKGAVEAPTLPATGNSGSILATIGQALGMIFVTAGALVYGKKEKIAKKK